MDLRRLQGGGLHVDGNGRTKLGRRALLAAGAAGVAAAAAQVATPGRVLAGNGDGSNVQIGFYNSGTATTVVATTGNEGFRGQSDVGDGVQGETNGALKSGVYGYSNHADGYGIFGRNYPSRATGYLGGKEHGVYGASAVQGKAAVVGEHSDPTGAGVQGSNTPGNAMGALGAGSVGVYASAPVDVDHAGLAVGGRAFFFDRAGVLTIAKNKSSVSSPAAGLANTTIVLATLQTNRPGVYVQAAVANPATGKITVYLNKSVSAATKVAIFILN
jgi:hypothetical protein